jgi:CsoR family transcriptional regulator, copper-sensing transcriptional repressor
MIDEERYCIDVLTQISAIRAALDKVALGLVDQHVRNCMRDADGKDEERVEELMGALRRLLTL